MSSVRMCDRCGSVFSERAEGWTSASASTMRKQEDGRRRAVSETIDLCPSCSPQIGGETTPYAITPGVVPGVPEAERIADTLTD